MGRPCPSPREALPPNKRNTPDMGYSWTNLAGPSTGRTTRPNHLPRLPRRPHRPFSDRSVDITIPGRTIRVLTRCLPTLRPTPAAPGPTGPRGTTHRPKLPALPKPESAPYPHPALSHPTKGPYLTAACARSRNDTAPPCRPAPGVSLLRDLPPIVVTGRRGLASRSRRGCRPAAAPSLLVRLGPRKPPELPVGACIMRATHPTPRGGG